MICDMTVKKLSEALKNKEISAVEVAEYYCKKKDLYGAFLYKDCDSVIEKARNLDERRMRGETLHSLAGIPIAVKDNICTAKIPTTCASKTLSGFVPPYNATVIEKIYDAEMTVLGKTNMDEFAMGSTGENSAYFPTKNPRNINLTPGGSSSGSAAAVAGGLAPIALGSDTGGSVRLPATYCGICGFKPSYGAVSRYGLIAFASSLDQIGILSKNISDCELLFDLISGKDFHDMTSVDVEKCSVENPRIGFFVKNELNISAQQVSLSLFEALLPIYYIISSAEASSNLARFDGVRYGLDSAFGKEVLRRIELGNFVLKAENIGEYYDKACRARELICMEMNKLFKEFDFIVMPTALGAPPKIGEIVASKDAYALDAYTVLANLAYLPAVSLPIGECGVTILAPRGKDYALLSFAKEVERLGI